MKFKPVLAFVIGLSLATAAGAQTKISGTLQCSKPDPMHAVEVGDRPNHSFSVSKVKCTWTKPIEMAEVKATDGTVTEFGETTGSSSSGRGYFVGNMANGDTFHVRYQSSAKLKDGAPQSVNGKWSFIRGAGKLKGLKGEGTHKGTAGSDGTITYEIEGEYALPK